MFGISDADWIEKYSSGLGPPPARFPWVTSPTTLMCNEGVYVRDAARWSFVKGAKSALNRLRRRRFECLWWLPNLIFQSYFHAIFNIGCLFSVDSIIPISIPFSEETHRINLLTLVNNILFILPLTCLRVRSIRHCTCNRSSPVGKIERTILFSSGPNRILPILLFQRRLDCLEFIINIIPSSAHTHTHPHLHSLITHYYTNTPVEYTPTRTSTR